MMMMAVMKLKKALPSRKRMFLFITILQKRSYDNIARSDDAADLCCHVSQCHHDLDNVYIQVHPGQSFLKS